MCESARRTFAHRRVLLVVLLASYRTCRTARPCAAKVRVLVLIADEAFDNRAALKLSLRRLVAG